MKWRTAQVHVQMAALDDRINFGFLKLVEVSFLTLTIKTMLMMDHHVFICFASGQVSRVQLKPKSFAIFCCICQIWNEDRTFTSYVLSRNRTYFLIICPSLEATSIL